MIAEMLVREKNEAKHQILLLPGRGMEGESILKIYELAEPEAQYFALTPKDLTWYPRPMGKLDIAEAIKGMPKAVEFVEKQILEIEDRYGVKRNDLIVAGFSAGAMVALQIAARNKQPLKAVISHSGAVLDIDGLTAAKNEMPVILAHAKDDCCLTWEERYEPMKRALFNKGYHLRFYEQDSGGHKIFVPQIKEILGSL
jgi:phospholipase/carboxylesterase